MDYEKAYKEALERAKKMFASKRSVIVEKQALETIFPELAESEDERMRKELLDYLHTRQVVEGLTDTKVKMYWIAWLEKQGEKSSPYKAAIESIATMVEKCDYFNIDLQDFFNNVKVKCKDAMEYDKTFNQE